MLDLHPVVTLPHDPILVAEVTAGCIRADARQGGALPLPDSAVYIADPDRGPNLLMSPAETAAAGGGQCFDLTRAEGGFRGTHVGCVRTPGGFHVFPAWMLGGGPLVHDISKMRGMPGDPVYDGAIYVPIWGGVGGATGRPGHDRPPPLAMSPSLGGGAWRQYVESVATPIVAGSTDRRSLRYALELQVGGEVDPSRKQALAALLIALRAIDNPELRSEVRELCLSSATTCSAQLLGAISALGGAGWLGRGAAGSIAGGYGIVSPLGSASAFIPQIEAPGACPGSCSIKNRRR